MPVVRVLRRSPRDQCKIDVPWADAVRSAVDCRAEVANPSDQGIRLMNETNHIAAVQMNSGENKEANLRKATELIQQAVAAGATLVALPELFNCLGPFETIIAQAEPIPGPTTTAMSDLAARLGITLLVGSLCEQSDTPGQGFNTSVLLGPDGAMLSTYRKLHLFDVDLPGQVTVRESQWMRPGEHVSVTPTSVGLLGHSICYDLRFPELYRALADRDAELIAVPAAFTMTTGRDHWEVLLRARAIENQAYVVAPNQCGHHGSSLHSYGHSTIIDPWGVVLAMAGEEDEAVVLAEMDLSRLRDIRQRVPSLAHRRNMS
jgi:predicted amidohydrolase